MLSSRHEICFYSTFKRSLSEAIVRRRFPWLICTTMRLKCSKRTKPSSGSCTVLIGG